MPRPPIPLEERFWRHVQKTDGCWLWTGCKSSRGHGRTAMSGTGGRSLQAHRVSWELHYAAIPAGLWVLHNCPGGDNPSCVRPEHLYLGTHIDNMADAAAKGQMQKGDQHYTRRDPSKRNYGDRNGARLHRDRMRHGDNHPMAKVGTKNAEAMRAMFESGWRQADLATHFGVARSTVCRTLRGKVWIRSRNNELDGENARASGQAEF